jgi:hypothetical protein
VEGTTDMWIQITNQQKIEENKLARNKTHFGQAKSTPFGKQICRIFRINATTIQLLEEGVIPKACSADNHYVQMFVKKRSNGKVIAIEEDITFEEFRAALDTWSEKTTTSPSG